MKKIYNFSKIIFFLPIFLLLLTITNPDSDSFFLIATGRKILETGSVPTINPFTHMQLHTIIQQWIVSILNATVYDKFGFMGILIYALIVSILIFVLILIYTRLFTKDSIPTAIICTLVFAGCFSFFTTRPNSFTICMIISELIVLEKYERTKNNKYLWIIPLISLMEINLHAAMWPIIICIAGIHILPEKFSKNFIKKDRLIFIPVIIISILVGLINPNGINGMLYVFYSLGSAEQFAIKELQKTTFLSQPGIIIIIGLILFILYIVKNKENVNLHTIIFTAFGLIFATKYLRGLYFVPIALIPIVCDLLHGNFKIKEKTKKEYTLLSILYIFLSVVLFTVLPFDTAIEDTSTMPVSAIEYLNKQENVKLYTGFNSGAYAELNGYKVYFDARPELYNVKIGQSEDYVTEYKNLLDGKLDYEEFLDKYNFTHILVTTEVQFNDYLKYNNGYEEVLKVEDEYILYEKR